MDRRKLSAGSLSLVNELGKPTDLWVRKLRTHFCRLDSNNDGILTRRDVEELGKRFQEATKMDIARVSRLYLLISDWWTLVSQGKESLSCEEYMLSYLPFVKNSFLRLDAEVRLSQQHREMFRLIDSDQNGSISIDEYEVFLGIVGITNKSFVKMAFESIDTDGNRRISEQEFVTAATNYFLNEKTELHKDMFGPLMTSFPLDAHRLSDLWLRKLTTLFCRMDPNEEDVISPMTLGTVATRFMTPDATDDVREEISEMFMDMWSNLSHGEHEIEIGDRGYLEIAGGRLKDPVIRDTLKEKDQEIYSKLFQLLDDDKDGHIVLNDYVRFLKNLGNVNQENAEIAFFCLDVEGRGFLDEKQFVKAAVEFLYDEEDGRSKYFCGPLIEL